MTVLFYWSEAVEIATSFQCKGYTHNGLIANLTNNTVIHGNPVSGTYMKVSWSDEASAEITVLVAGKYWDSISKTVRQCSTGTVFKVTGDFYEGLMVTAIRLGN